MEKQFEILTTARFYLELALDGSQEPIDAYFMECQGFKRTQELIEICEVTPQKWGKHNAKTGRVVRTKLPGNTKSENIILRRGMTISMTMWKWFKAVEEGDWATQGKNGDLTIYNQGAEEKARFRFQGAWPISYKIADVKAGSNDFEVEELELSVDEFTRVK
ncbi:MAG: phage tail protein [Symploca sp. SIO2E6]|nr:phage tail protein [Symploca sp. SIO2E6]